MMRHPFNQTLPQHLDPWAFARARQHCEGSLSLADTHTLREWKIADEPLYASLEGSLDEHQQPHLSGRVAVELTTQCQRCLKPMPLSIARDFDYVIIRNQLFEDRVEGPYESLICEDESLDVAWFLEEEVLLAMPMIAKHEDCEAPPMVDDGLDVIDDEPRNNPFAALKNLINAKE